jgi:hypothetical protein
VRPGTHGSTLECNPSRLELNTETGEVSHSPLYICCSFAPYEKDTHLLISTCHKSMRLINCKTLHLEDFVRSSTSKYAILSHTWGSEEVSFATFTTDLAAARSTAGFRKIELTCQQAIADGLEYAWVDTVCIDKSSSAELSEAINSMFHWYEDASVCYVYLSDVTKNGFAAEFRKSRWFQRGWTLQELIAPNNVVFFDSAWNELGSRGDHARLIHAITHIDEWVLKTHMWVGRHSRPSLEDYCVAERMAWVSHRETTRIEDMAYCLLGIFNVNMPLLYGEGNAAFLRLQEEIIKVLDDDSILAWGRQTDALDLDTLKHMVIPMDDEPNFSSLLAKSPKDFAGCYDMKWSVDSISPYTMTNQGLTVELPLIEFVPRKADSGEFVQKFAVGILTCTTSTKSALLGILLAESDNSRTRMHRVAVNTGDFTETDSAMIFFLGPRLAAQAVPRRITVTNTLEKFIYREISTTHLQLLVNQSKTLRPFGHIVTGGKSLSSQGAHDSVTWDSDASVLTVDGKYWDQHVIDLTFKSHCADRQYSGFSVLIHANNAIVRNGSALCLEEQKTCYEILDSQIRKTDEEENVVLTTDDDRKVIIVATMSDIKERHHWSIRQVNIEAIDVTGLLTTDFPAERHLRRSEFNRQRWRTYSESTDDSQSSE